MSCAFQDASILTSRSLIVLSSSCSKDGVAADRSGAIESYSHPRDVAGRNLWWGLMIFQAPPGLLTVILQDPTPFFFFLGLRGIPLSSKSAKTRFVIWTLVRSYCTSP